MFRHLFSLIWNRKRANALLITEIALSFLVLFVVGSLAVYNYANYRLPPGFAHENVWELNLNPGQDSTDRQATMRLVLQQLRAVPGVVRVAATSSNTPFSFSTMSTSIGYGPRQAQANRYEADDAFARTLDLHLTAGRWFDRRDDAAPRTPVVVNQALARQLFPDGPALGKVLHDGDKRWQVVGVVDVYRSANDFTADEPAFFERRELRNAAPAANYGVPTLLVQVQPHSNALLEQQLVKTIRQTSGGWNTTVSTLAQNRVNKLKVVLTPLLALGIVGVFLIVNVMLGIFGVLWYNISQRRTEIGLRRAMGATHTAISGQFLGEIAVVTTLGVALGALLAVQFPLLGVLGVAPTVYGQAMLLATALILLLTTLCAWYPSQLAARIQPAVALREE